MKFVDASPLSNPQTAAGRLLELVNAFEPIQDGRTYIGPFLSQFKGAPAEHKAGLDYAIAKGWLMLHESGTYVRLTDTGAALFA